MILCILCIAIQHEKKHKCFLVNIVWPYITEIMTLKPQTRWYSPLCVFPKRCHGPHKLCTEGPARGNSLCLRAALPKTSIKFYSTSCSFSQQVLHITDTLITFTHTHTQTLAVVQSSHDNPKQMWHHIHVSTQSRTCWSLLQGNKHKAEKETEWVSLSDFLNGGQG